MSKISVVIADDHSLIRDCIKFMLHGNEEIEFAGEASNVEELLSLLEKQKTDIVLLDVSMPKIDGITAISMILDKYPIIGIIMLSMHDEAEMISSCIKAGALSYLLKNTEKEELILAIKQAYLHKEYIPQQIKQILIENQESEATSINESISLSRREKEVLDCISEGLSTKQIADKLCISVRTVESHRYSLLKKFNAQNAVELVNALQTKKLFVKN